MKIKNNNLWVENLDCLEFIKKIPNNSVDLILTDPPFGIGESQFDKKHYFRKSENILNGYVEAPIDINYSDWVFNWISEFDRILKPNGSIFIFSSWNNEADIQIAFRQTKKFKLINHLIWNYNFGTYTKNKFVTSHYHILYYSKIKGKPYFNKNAFFADDQKDNNNKSLVYDDIQSVIKINREFKKGKIKNSNQLPFKLVEKLIKHTTKINDIVFDPFSGSFTTQFSALKLKRKTWGCEINKNACEYFFPKLENFKETYNNEIDLIGYPKCKKLANQGKRLTAQEKDFIKSEYLLLRIKKPNLTKKQAITLIGEKFKRGY